MNRRPWMEELLETRAALGLDPCIEPGDDEPCEAYEERLANDRAILFDAKHRPVALPVPPAPVFDTHTHLSMLSDGTKQLSGESVAAAADAIVRAFACGVMGLICIADVTEDARDARAFLDWIDRVQEAAFDQYVEEVEWGALPGRFYEREHVGIAAGIHPYGAAQVDDDTLNRLLVILKSRQAVAVGEMGLDYHCDVDPELQKEAFRRQLEVAAELGLPVELHVRDAADDPDYLAHRDALEIVTDAGVAPLGIDLHCYTLGPEPLEGWLELGARVAFGGAMTFKRSDDIREAVRLCPLDRIITETDSPYMAPEPLRGTRCEPAMTLATAWRIAEVRQGLDASPKATFDALWHNACDLFGLSA